MAIPPYLYDALRRRLTGRGALGQGDIKLLAALGVWLGPLALLAHLGASIVGLLFAACFGTRRQIPYGTCLAIATPMVFPLIPLLEERLSYLAMQLLL